MTKNKKYWKRRLGSYALMDEYEHHIDLRKIPELDDVGLEVVLANVKGVTMLDLNETEITNKAITLLTQLEYVEELRAKNCYLDNDCIADLNKLSTLKFLHVRSTKITIDGLLKLTNLTSLETLMFSAEEQDAMFTGKMIQLKSVLPNCEFVIDSKPYVFAEENWGDYE